MSAVQDMHIVGKDETAEPEQAVESGNGAPAPQAAEAVDKTSRDMGKVALFISILAVVLLVVFFFGLNQNLSGLTTKVDGLLPLKDDVGALTSRMGTVEERVVALEGLPQKARKMVMGTMLQEMAQRTAYLGTQMDTEEQNAKLRQAMELLREVQVQVAGEAGLAPAPSAAPAEPAVPVAPEASVAPAAESAAEPVVEPAAVAPAAAAPAAAESAAEPAPAAEPGVPPAAPQQ